MNKQTGFGMMLLAGALALPLQAGAQGVATPSPVQGQPLAPPPGAAPSPAEPTPVQPPAPPAAPALPQPVNPPPTAPAEPQPVAPPPAVPLPGSPSPAPALPPAPVPSPPPAQQQTGPVDANSTLAGRKGDPSDVDEIALAPKPALIRPGQSNWDDGFKTLADAIASLRAEAARLNLPVAGRPLTLFVETTDTGFRFEAMLPVARLPQGMPSEGVRAGSTPEGKAFRFVHLAPYDDIDSTYETITAYLEAKNQPVKDAFLEEYVSDLKDPGDPNLEINVYVQPR